MATITEETAKKLIGELRENNKLLQWQKEQVQSKAESWIRAAQIPLYTIWKDRIDLARARRHKLVNFKQTNEGGKRMFYLYDLNSINEKFLVKENTPNQNKSPEGQERQPLNFI